MGDRLRFLLNRINERLWVRPLAMCVLSTAVVFLAKTADNTGIGQLVPAITPDSIETLLTIISTSMLVISTFAVASMVSAYASASSAALLFAGYLRRRFQERSLDLYWYLYL